MLFDRRTVVTLPADPNMRFAWHRFQAEDVRGCDTRRIILVSPSHPLRAETERCIREVYARMFGASELAFPSTLIALLDGNGRSLCAAGLRTAAEVAQPHVVGQNAAEFDLREVAEKIEAVLLVRTQVGLQSGGQRNGGHKFEIPHPRAQRLRFRRIGEPRQLAFVQMRDVFHADFLWHGDKAVHAHFGHRLVRALHGGGVQFHPAGIRQLHERAGGGGEPFEIGLGKFESFGLPFGGNGQPVNTTSLNDEPRLS